MKGYSGRKKRRIGKVRFIENHIFEGVNTPRLGQTKITLVRFRVPKEDILQNENQVYVSDRDTQV